MKKYTIHLPHYKADMYGVPTSMFVGDECLRLLRDVAVDYIGGITVLTDHSYGLWSMDDMIIRDAQTICVIVCSDANFNKHVLPVLQSIKEHANQKSLFVTASHVDIVDV